MIKLQRPLLLGIETSCDDTACAVVDGSGRVLASQVSRQLASHQPFGGVVPEIASREHLENWPAVSQVTLTQAGVTWQDFDAVAATRGPGLVGSLLVGLSLGRAIAFALDRPFHGMHHLEGHLYSPFLASSPGPAAPIPAHFVGLVVSGGHASLLAVDHGAVHSLAETRDDAMGEVFDKVGKRLGLPYPQGPLVDRLAERGDPRAFPFKLPRVESELFFSFAGLKSQTLRALAALEAQGVLTPTRRLDPDDLPQPALDLLAGFRQAAVRQVSDRVDRLHRRQPFSLLAVSGGAAANRLLRDELQTWATAKGVDLRLVPLVYAGDNAAMIAFAALLRERRGERDDPRDSRVASRIPFAPLPDPGLPAPPALATKPHPGRPR